MKTESFKESMQSLDSIKKMAQLSLAVSTGKPERERLPDGFKIYRTHNEGEGNYFASSFYGEMEGKKALCIVHRGTVLDLHNPHDVLEDIGIMFDHSIEDINTGASFCNQMVIAYYLDHRKDESQSMGEFYRSMMIINVGHSLGSVIAQGAQLFSDHALVGLTDSERASMNWLYIFDDPGAGDMLNDSYKKNPPLNINKDTRAVLERVLASRSIQNSVCVMGIPNLINTCNYHWSECMYHLPNGYIGVDSQSKYISIDGITSDWANMFNFTITSMSHHMEHIAVHIQGMGGEDWPPNHAERIASWPEHYNDQWKMLCSVSDKNPVYKGVWYPVSFSKWESDGDEWCRKNNVKYTPRAMNPMFYGMMIDHLAKASHNHVLSSATFFRPALHLHLRVSKEAEEMKMEKEIEMTGRMYQK